MYTNGSVTLVNSFYHSALWSQEPFSLLHSDYQLCPPSNYFRINVVSLIYKLHVILGLDLHGSFTNLLPWNFYESLESNLNVFLCHCIFDWSREHTLLNHSYRSGTSIWSKTSLFFFADLLEANPNLSVLKNGFNRLG